MVTTTTSAGVGRPNGEPGHYYCPAVNVSGDACGWLHFPGAAPGIGVPHSPHATAWAAY